MIQLLVFREGITVWGKVTGLPLEHPDAPKVTARNGPERKRQQAARKAWIRDQLGLGLLPLGEQWGGEELVVLVGLNGHRRFPSARHAQKFAERWVWHHQRGDWPRRMYVQFATSCSLYDPFSKRDRYTNGIEELRAKAERWDALQARKKRQRLASRVELVQAGVIKETP